VNADDLDLAELGEYDIKRISAMYGDTVIFVKSDESSYYYRLKHKNKSVSDIKDISMDDLRSRNLMVYPKLKGKDLALILLSEMV
jgi:hypothetical protein